MVRGSEVLSLVGAALLRGGWTTDVSLLDSPCLVVGEHAGQARREGEGPSEPSRWTGECDSSVTRVAPVFCELLARDPTGRTWLPSLVTLPVREGRDGVRLEGVEPLEEARFGAGEKPLAAPQSLLKRLVQHPERLTRRGDPSEDAPERVALLAEDEAMRQQALRSLDAPKLPERAWYLFEGASYPDVFLRTRDLIVVIEGKRTEPGITTDTTWMPVRHQMLRHLDGAWDMRGRRCVVGFFIVEGGGDAEAVEVPVSWRKQCEETVRADVLEASLPHRTLAERAEIANGYLGVTTWQQVCLALDVSYAGLPERA